MQVVPKVAETVTTIEETKRTEEVERRVKAQEKREKKEKRKKKGESRERRHHSHHSSSHHQSGPRPGAVDYPPWTVPFGKVDVTCYMLLLHVAGAFVFCSSMVTKNYAFVLRFVSVPIM